MDIWSVNYTSTASKKAKKLPKQVAAALAVFDKELRGEGPYRKNWKNYSKLETNKYHCHLKKGHPTYVICWEIKDKKNKILEVYYVGTHEKAPC